jgi:hypothetical protein
VHEPRDEARQQLALAEDDLDLVLRTLRDVGRPVIRVSVTNLGRQELRAPVRAAADDQEQQREDDGAYERAFRSSALIAGTISCRSPMTA